jgi:hypothetical protein
MMSKKGVYFVIYMCSSLLFIQWSGMHMHSSANDLDNSLHTSYLHGFDTDHHSHEVGYHENDVDIDLFEINHSWTKQIQFFILIAIVLIANLNFFTFIRPPPLSRISLYIFSYLRPILRAPPASL